MIVRDACHIICQHDPKNPAYLDGGDSCNRTAIMALCGSMLDANLLPLFHVRAGILVRHPEQRVHRNPNNFSRDQALPYVAGLRQIGRYDIAEKVFWAHAKRGFFCQNTHFHPSGVKKEFPQGPDFLHPGQIWHLILCARIFWLYWLAPIGYFFQFLDLLWSCYVKPWDEQNQVFCQFHVSGLLDLYKAKHPNYRLAMEQYWGGWRSQKEIAAAINKI